MIGPYAIGKGDRDRTVQHRAHGAMRMPIVRLTAWQGVVMRRRRGGMNGGLMVMLHRRRRRSGARPGLDHVHEMDRQIELDGKRQNAEPGAETSRLETPKHHARTMIAARHPGSARR
jgi:hypothetical protein